MPDYVAEARRAARRHGLDPNIFVRQIRQESGFDPNVTSPAGAVGIAQIMPATARGWGVNPRNPSQSLDAAARNMASYVRRYGSYENALRAYNAGPGRIAASRNFAETNNYVRTILGGRDPGGLSSSRSSSAPPSTSSTAAPETAGPDPALRQQALLSYLQDRGNPNALLGLASTLKGLQASGGTDTGSVAPAGQDAGPAGTSAPGALGAIIGEANRIDRAGVPYQWGGGHTARQIRGSRVTPLDCSGAVSRALGINPRVSGQFAKWGAPGEGRNVTIYANPGHVLMKVRVNGKWRFWGTSRTNPGGGAGWIDASAITPDYLKRFTARHPAGL